MNKVYKTVFACCIAAALCFCGCRQGASAEQDKKEIKDQAVPVEVATVSRGNIEATLKTSAHLEAEEDVKVYARTSNRVIELHVEEGDRLQKGQLLLRLDNDIQKNQFIKAEAKLLKAKQEFERQKALFDQKLISEQAFHDAQFELKQLELALDDARRELEYTEIRAPIAGTLTKRLVKYGDLVNLNQHLFDIIDFSSTVARVFIPEKNLPSLDTNVLARVTANALGDKEFKGYIKRIAPVVDSKSGTVKVTVAFQEVGELRPGMYVDVQLITATRNDAILISKRAVVMDGDQRFVFRLLPERKVERIALVERLQDRINIEPASGFKEGDQIVVAGQTGLKDGSKVRLPGDPIPGENKDSKEVASKNGKGAGT